MFIVIATFTQLSVFIASLYLSNPVSRGEAPFVVCHIKIDRLCGLVADYKHRGPGFDSRALLRIFLRELGLERGPLSLVIG
jgi:hypothetical protein